MLWEEKTLREELKGDVQRQKKKAKKVKEREGGGKEGKEGDGGGGREGEEGMEGRRVGEGGNPPEQKERNRAKKQN